MRYGCVLLIGWFVLCMISLPVYSATIQLDSAAQSEVYTAVQNASIGDTIVLPPTQGPVVWEEGVGIPDDKRLIIKGAGPTATVINKTTDGSALTVNNSFNIAFST